MINKFYCIFEKNETGKLIIPRHSWCNGHREETVFNEYGYSSFEEAVEAIEEYGETYTEYYVIPKVTKIK